MTSDGVGPKRVLRFEVPRVSGGFRTLEVLFLEHVGEFEAPKAWSRVTMLARRQLLQFECFQYPTLALVREVLILSLTHTTIRHFLTRYLPKAILPIISLFETPYRGEVIAQVTSFDAGIRAASIRLNSDTKVKWYS